MTFVLTLLILVMLFGMCLAFFLGLSVAHYLSRIADAVEAGNAFYGVPKKEPEEG